MNDSLQKARLGQKLVGEKAEKECGKRRQVESERGSGVTSLLEMTDCPSLSFLSLQIICDLHSNEIESSSSRNPNFLGLCW